MAHGIKVRLNNPKLLEWARKEVGLSKLEVANRFNKSEDTIISWENGSDAPTFRQLKDLANYYKRPTAAFFFREIPPRTPKPTDYRMLRGVARDQFTKETLIAYRELYGMVSKTQDLLNEINSDIKFSLPTFNLDGNPEEKAEQLRSHLGFSVERQIKEFDSYYIAQDVWRSLLFDHGVVVRICMMPINDARAFCLFNGDCAGIGLSNEDREHGRIFSLFHELCHLSLGQPGVSGISTNYRSQNQEIEDYCDKFSASFLLPSSHPDVIRFLQEFSASLSFESGRSVASRFKVSKYVVLRRAFDLSMIANDVYWELVNKWKSIDASTIQRQKSKLKDSPSGNYNATQISYNGKRFVSLVMEALNRNFLTKVEVKRILGISPSAVETNW